MSNFKVVKNAAGGVVCFGPNTEQYEPSLANGQTLSIEELAPTPPSKTVLELDTEKYLRRSNAKPLLMAKMAAMNIGRLKNGTWTKAQLVSLMSEDATKSLIDHMETLSFELAIDVVKAHPNALLTPEIKAGWVAELFAAL